MLAECLVVWDDSRVRIPVSGAARAAERRQGAATEEDDPGNAGCAPRIFRIGGIS